jgi:hypothetical protein
MKRVAFRGVAEQPPTLTLTTPLIGSMTGPLDTTTLPTCVGRIIG